MYNVQNSSPVVTDCTFTANSAVLGNGGGMYNNAGTPAVVTACTFTGNSATGGGSGSRGGGMHNDMSAAVVSRCVFTGNSTSAAGGGVSNRGLSPEFTNCLFTDNITVYEGGGMFSFMSTPNITNCTFSQNSADLGGAIANSSSDATLTNCVLWGDSATSSDPEILNDSSSPAVTYSDVEGGYAGTGNIDQDPLFAAGPDGDYYLSQTAAGQASQSPCVDAGSATAAGLGLDAATTRTDGVGDAGQVDIGYHYQP
jgi:predicted outer membrane repeat protein